MCDYKMTWTSCKCLLLFVAILLHFLNHPQVSGFLFSSGRQSSDRPPAFCNGLSCPTYTEKDRGKGYEVRKYDRSKWVSTSESSIEWGQVKSQMFWRLFSYIGGNNYKGQKIDMTVPVTTMIQRGRGPACNSNFTMSFYIADEVNPPEPNDTKVFLVDQPSFEVYVRSFGGYASEQDYLNEANALKNALPARYNCSDELFYTAGYDAPYKFWNRHNEVWLLANE